MISFEFLNKIYTKDKSIFADFEYYNLKTAILPIMRYMAMDIDNLEVVKRIEPYWTFIKPIHILALLFLGVKKKRFCSKYAFFNVVKYIKKTDIEKNSKILEQMRKYLKYTHKKFEVVKSILQNEVNKNSKYWESQLGIKGMSSRRKGTC